MKKRRGVWRAVARAMIGIVFFVSVGAGVRAMLERTPWTRTVSYQAPDASTTLPAALPSVTPSPTIEADTEPLAEEVIAPPVAAILPTFFLSDAILEQSDTFTVRLENIPTGFAPTVDWNGRSYDLLQMGEHWLGFLGVDAKQTPGPYRVEAKIGTTTLIETVSVAKRAFPVTVLTVTPELEEQGYNPPAIQSNVAAENARLNRALIYTPRAYFSKPFVNPLDDIVIVGAYGNIRKSGTVELQHLGTDLDAVEGSSVYAINDGVVNLAENFTNYGKTIVVDHGVGIFSFYLHLNEFNVKVGDRVTRGQVIAKSGNTGYSIAPHLHFSVRIRNASVDPLRFIETANEALIDTRVGGE